MARWKPKHSLSFLARLVHSKKPIPRGLTRSERSFVIGGRRAKAGKKLSKAQSTAFVEFRKTIPKGKRQTATQKRLLDPYNKSRAKKDRERRGDAFDLAKQARRKLVRKGFDESEVWVYYIPNGDTNIPMRRMSLAKFRDFVREEKYEDDREALSQFGAWVVATEGYYGDPVNITLEITEV